MHFDASWNNPYVRCSYILMLLALLTGFIVAAVKAWAALIPIAIIFGWSQTGTY